MALLDIPPERRAKGGDPVEVNGKVYIITKGEYSDYHICAVTMDKSRAEYLKRLMSSTWSEASIEEYVLNEVKESGDLYYVEFPEDSQPTIRIDEYDGFGGYGDTPCVEDCFEPVRICVRSKDEKHAMKIAQDEYAKWKAEKEGV